MNYGAERSVQAPATHLTCGFSSRYHASKGFVHLPGNLSRCGAMPKRGAAAKAASTPTPKKGRTGPLPNWAEAILSKAANAETCPCPFSEVCGSFGIPDVGPTSHQGLADAIATYLEGQGSTKKMLLPGGCAFPEVQPDDRIRSKSGCDRVGRSLYSAGVVGFSGRPAPYHKLATTGSIQSMQIISSCPPELLHINWIYIGTGSTWVQTRCEIVSV